MTIKETIKKAIEGGYQKDTIEKVGYDKFLHVALKNFEAPLMSYKFWQALGKAMGWSVETFCPFHHGGGDTEECEDGDYVNETEMKWHEFIHHLAEGKDAESYFKEL